MVPWRQTRDHTGLNDISLDGWTLGRFDREMETKGTDLGSRPEMRTRRLEVFLMDEVFDTKGEGDQ